MRRIRMLATKRNSARVIRYIDTCDLAARVSSGRSSQLISSAKTGSITMLSDSCTNTACVLRTPKAYKERESADMFSIFFAVLVPFFLKNARKNEKPKKMLAISVSMLFVAIAVSTVAIYHTWRAGLAPSVYILDAKAADAEWRKLWLGDERRTGAPVTRHEVGDVEVRPPSTTSSAVVVDGVLVFSRDKDAAGWVWVRRKRNGALKE